MAEMTTMLWMSIADLPVCSQVNLPARCLLDMVTIEEAQDLYRYTLESVRRRIALRCVEDASTDVSAKYIGVSNRGVTGNGWWVEWKVVRNIDREVDWPLCFWGENKAGTADVRPGYERDG